MGCRERLRYMLLPACLLPILGCIYTPLTLSPYDVPPAGGTIEIKVMLRQPHAALTLAWSGKWLKYADVSNSAGSDVASGSLAPQNTAALQLISFGVSGELRAGWWEFAMTGSVGDADAFIPIVCRQQIRSGMNVTLEAQEGSYDCTSPEGGEGPKSFLWGEGAGNLPNSVFPSSTEAFPDVADNTGSLRLLFFLVKQDTLPEQVTEVKAGFYNDNNGQPGTLIASFTLPLKQRLADRGGINTTTNTLKGDTWVWFDLDTDLGASAVPVQQGQTYYLGLLDLCPPAPQPCNTTTKVFHFYSGNTRTVFKSPNSGETALPSPWPAGGPTFANTAPAVAFGLSAGSNYPLP